MMKHKVVQEMSSHAYIASDGTSLMKVGKANDPTRREKEIALPITVTVACLDEAAAFRVERQLREFVIGQGGIRHQSTIDWFQFDVQIYGMLCEFAGTIDGFVAIPMPEKDIDAEIADLRARYFELLIFEAKSEVNELRNQLIQSNIHVTQLRQEIAQLHEQYVDEIKSVIHETGSHYDPQLDTLIREGMEWKMRYEHLKEQADKLLGDKHDE